MERSGNLAADNAIAAGNSEPLTARAAVVDARPVATPPDGLPDCARIKTLIGERRARDLRPGDRVLTRDNGYQPLRWSGILGLDGSDPTQRPIRICKGALGRSLPERVLTVAPGQRFLIGGADGLTQPGLPEVTITAAQLTSLKGIGPLPGTPPGFVQLLFDRHELILAEGAWTESLYLTPEALTRLPDLLTEANTTSPARPPAPPDLLTALLALGQT